MSDIGADVLAEWRVVPEDVASLSVFAFCSRGGFVVEGVLIFILLCFNVLSTVPHENRLADFLLCSRLVEHSTIVRHGKIQRQLLHKEYTASITK